MHKSVLGPKLDVLMEIIKNGKFKSYIEIGCYQCVTLEYVSSIGSIFGLERCVGFDLFEAHSGEHGELGVGVEYAPLDGPPVSYEEAVAMGLEVYKGDTKVTLPSILPTLKLAEPVLAFVDGGHSFETCLADIKNVVAAYPRATLVVDDCDYPGVTRAVNECGLASRGLPYFLALVNAY